MYPPGGIGLELPSTLGAIGFVLVHVLPHTCNKRPDRLLAPRPIADELESIIKSDLDAVRQRVKKYPEKQHPQGQREWNEALARAKDLRLRYTKPGRWRVDNAGQFGCWTLPDALRYPLLAQLERHEKATWPYERWCIVFTIPIAGAYDRRNKITVHWRHPNYHGCNAAGRALRSLSGCWNSIKDRRVRVRTEGTNLVVELG